MRKFSDAGVIWIPYRGNMDLEINVSHKCQSAYQTATNDANRKLITSKTLTALKHKNYISELYAPKALLVGP